MADLRISKLGCGSKPEDSRYVGLMDKVLAIDIGGTKMSCGVVNENGELTNRSNIPTRVDATEDGEQLYDRLRQLVKGYAPFDQYLACGIGSAGPMRSGGADISPLNIKPWRNFPLAARVEADTGLLTRLTNDVKALALGEAWVGAAQGEPNFMAMVVSTGVGGGIVLDGRLLEGREGNAGHIGHVVVDYPGRNIADHVSGTLEAEASGTAIAHHTGTPAEEATLEVIKETGRFVGQAAGSAMNLLDMKLMVVAGGVALGFGDPFFESAQAEVDRICQLSFTEGAKIVPAGCGADGPLIGAGAVGFRALQRYMGGVT